MNYVKKLLKHNWLLLSGLLLIILSISLLTVLYIRNNKKLEFFTIQNEYYIEFSDNTLLNTSIKCSRKDTMYLDKELINEVFIYDNLTKEEYLLELIDIERKDLYQYNNKNYYNYELKLLIPFKSDSVISLDNCYMAISYSNNEKLEFKIGKLFLYNKEESNKALLISSLKGIVTTYDEKMTLCGIIMSLDIENKPIIITNIETLASDVLINKSSIIVLDHLDYEATTPIKDILGYDYDLFKSALDYEFSYEVENNIKLFLPLTYLDKVHVSTLCFKITYILDGKEYFQIIEPFKFFKNNNDTLIDFFNYDIN